LLNEFSRTELLIGKEAMEKLRNSKVAIFGIGGVGSYVAEGLIRAGVYKFILIDDDKICLTNLNRQLHATRKTVGQYKIDAMKNRMLDINPKAEIITHQTFYMPDNSDNIIDNSISYIVDAIDTVTAKIDLVCKATAMGIPIISCMGAGNKLNAAMFEVADIYKTSMCPLAKVMRHELRERGITHLKVVYSKEQPIKIDQSCDASCKANCICPKGTLRSCTKRRQIPGSISFVPSVAGLIIAGEVVKDLIEDVASKGKI
jgi:tRNA A37 threonylcarbamoyladenosine dehydratase